MPLAWNEKLAALRRENDMRTMAGEFDDLAQKAVDTRNMSGEWGPKVQLQIDSYATGQQLVHAFVREDGLISIEVTDGSSTWKGKLQPPKGWNP